ncbi:hypothetical protein LMG24235_03572 [Paraburkholderia sabiae]|nr:hypothetical protein LMG24235_03572 [Paraburkholderia sabiae]
MLEIFLVCEAATGRPAPGIAGDMAGTWVAGRLAALRYSYAIVRAAHAAAPRGEPHAGRASNGRSEAASASSDLPILVPNHDSTAGWGRAFARGPTWRKGLRFGFSGLSATLVAMLWFSLASALPYRFASVAPVRGGTYFSLPAAKKSRQKKAAFEPPVPARITLRHAAVELSRSDVRTL